MTYAIEGSLLGALGFTAIIEAVSENDWTKIKGPEGALFLSVVIIVVLWNASRIREKNENVRREKEEAAREGRHTETLKLQRENADKLMELTAESIKAHGMSVRAIGSMDRTIMALTEEMKSRPCQLPELR